MPRLAIISPDGNRMVAATFNAPLKEAMALAVSANPPVRFEETTEPVENFTRILVCRESGWKWMRPVRVPKSLRV